MSLMDFEIEIFSLKRFKSLPWLFDFNHFSFGYITCWILGTWIGSQSDPQPSVRWTYRPGLAFSSCAWPELSWSHMRWPRQTGSTEGFAWRNGWKKHGDTKCSLETNTLWPCCWAKHQDQFLAVQSAFPFAGWLPLTLAPRSCRCRSHPALDRIKGKIGISISHG